MVVWVTFPEKVNAPKLSTPVTVPPPLPAPALVSVPAPLPTVFAENVKFSVCPETEPDPLPDSFPRPRL
jgi:hypothetical protein